MIRKILKEFETFRLTVHVLAHTLGVLAIPPFGLEFSLKKMIKKGFSKKMIITFPAFFPS